MKRSNSNLPSNIVLGHIKQKFTELKGRMEKSIIIVGNLNKPLPTANRPSQGKNQCTGAYYDGLSKPENCISQNPFFCITLGYR